MKVGAIFRFFRQADRLMSISLAFLNSFDDSSRHLCILNSRWLPLICVHAEKQKQRRKNQVNTTFLQLYQDYQNRRASARYNHSHCHPRYKRFDFNLFNTFFNYTTISVLSQEIRKYNLLIIKHIHSNVLNINNCVLSVFYKCWAHSNTQHNSDILILMPKEDEMYLKLVLSAFLSRILCVVFVGASVRHTMIYKRLF